MKKTLAIIPAVALAFAFSTSLALASYQNNDSCCNNSHDRGSRCCPALNVLNTNDANTTNNISSVANTGRNGITISSDAKKHEHDSRGTSAASIFTGYAGSSAWADTTANTSSVEVAAPTTGTTNVTNTNNANTTNNVSSKAKTGRNYITGSRNATIDTGNASSEASAIVVVNSSVVKVTK